MNTRLLLLDFRDGFEVIERNRSAEIDSYLIQKDFKTKRTVLSSLFQTQTSSTDYVGTYRARVLGLNSKKSHINGCFDVRQAETKRLCYKQYNNI